MTGPIRLFLCGDVMPGRGIDQVLPHPGSPELREEYVKSAAEYVRLAERKNGPIQRPVSYEYVWGDALADLQRERPIARIINLETSITASADFASKAVNYRMNPANIGVLAAMNVDCCVLSNNHVLDFGVTGLNETLRTLDTAHLRHAGAGANTTEATAPAQVPLPDGRRLLVFGFGAASSGIPTGWAAGAARPGVNLLTTFSDGEVRNIAQHVHAIRNVGDLLIASIHWGANWGYDISPEHRRVARALIDIGFDLVHGHSSHHPKGIEIYRDRLVLYGCGDFITDYEGIGSYAEFRPDLSVAYLPEFAGTGALTGLTMTVYQLRKFRLNSASSGDSEWIRQVVGRESASHGVRIRTTGGNRLLASPG